MEGEDAQCTSCMQREEAKRVRDLDELENVARWNLEERREKSKKREEKMKVTRIMDCKGI